MGAQHKLLLPRKLFDGPAMALPVSCVKLLVNAPLCTGGMLAPQSGYLDRTS